MVQEQDPRFSPRPIVLITGATGAVGFGICLRLLYQLSQPIQADLSEPFVYQSQDHRWIKPLEEEAEEEEEQDEQSCFATPNGLTLLIGCRSEKKFNTTKKNLQKKLIQLMRKEKKIEQEQVKFSYIDRETGQVEAIKFEEYRSNWSDNLCIEWVPLDLYESQSVLTSIKLITERYGYLTHLLLNAGGGPFVGIDWFGLIKAFIFNLRQALTYPDYLIQASKVIETKDGMPETWQLNVLSHYLIARESLELLSKGRERYSKMYPNLRSRIIWTSSLDGESIYFNKEDIECFTFTSHTYQSTKYQSELLGQGFHQIISNRGLGSQVVSLVAHPGVVAGNMFTLIIGKMMDAMMTWVFYFARTILGSPHHLIEGYLSAIVWTKLSLTEAPKRRKEAGEMVRYGAQCDRWGRPFVVKEDLVGSNELELSKRIDHQRRVLTHCDHKANALIRLAPP